MSHKVSRREFVGAALAGAAIVARAPSLAQAQTARPNILFILADDLGYGDWVATVVPIIKLQTWIASRRRVFVSSTPIPLRRYARPRDALTLPDDIQREHAWGLKNR